MPKIIFRNDKSLRTISDSSIYIGEKNADNLEVLIPPNYKEIEIDNCKIRLTYITPDDVEHSFFINDYKQDYLYKDMYVYLINIDGKFTYISGDIKIYLSFVSIENEKDVLLKSDTTTLRINEHLSKSDDNADKNDIIDEMTLLSLKSFKIAQSVRDDADAGKFKELNINSAKEKDIPIVTKVDENNKPTEWQTVNMDSLLPADWELLETLDVTDDNASMAYEFNNFGEYDEMCVDFENMYIKQRDDGTAPSGQMLGIIAVNMEINKGIILFPLTDMDSYSSDPKVTMHSELTKTHTGHYDIRQYMYFSEYDEDIDNFLQTSSNTDVGYSENRIVAGISDDFKFNTVTIITCGFFGNPYIRGTIKVYGRNKKTIY